MEPPETPESEACAALRYLENRLARLDHPVLLRDGPPVGSGMMETAHRHLLSPV